MNEALATSEVENRSSNEAITCLLMSSGDKQDNYKSNRAWVSIRKSYRIRKTDG